MEQESDDEYKAITSVLSSYFNFHNFQSSQLVDPRIKKHEALSSEDRQILPWYQQHTQFIQQCIEINRDFCQTLAEKIGQDWGIEQPPTNWANASPDQFAQTETILLQLMREWSDQGEKERRTGQDLIIYHLNELFPDKLQRQYVKVLVPGCGIGRLVFELVMKGYWTQGNDVDYHALFASNFVLNHCQFPHNYSIIPFLATSASNSTRRQNQIRPVTIPDVSPTAEIINAMKNENEKKIRESTNETPPTERIPFDELMSITAGSFTDLYGSGTNNGNPASQEIRSQSQGEFDVVVTEFFLNSVSSNIIDSIRTINNVLKQGGTWINFGPLSIDERIRSSSDRLDLSRDDLFELISKLGFGFSTKESGIETTYLEDAKSMNTSIYKCEFWVCTKINNI
ncbi:hypothetical protein CANMA_003395 [Candida margitis]|uniref:uncharacterized protein n=1 Tax=Candida margitis TaxID=1775924 RepID=UPI002226E189|nr:uncharacterized protein CANMA_003395 [Candida margitis]KAI5965533.1 hypothetical protein CANMA_003395 [Candida margitis]